MSADGSAEKKIASVLTHVTNAAATAELIDSFKDQHGVDVLAEAARQISAMAGISQSDPVVGVILDELGVMARGWRRCNCGHRKIDHQNEGGLGGAQCKVCPGDSERSWRHEFTPAHPQEAT
ncbi:hypothetical protein [Streptomyces sp. 5-10]|uniref:hypothetical protein n=1 Tax=Streptomyces sp. 5-10 TaxID=878925 RepID=UPI00168AD79C|nr:hypothetical protein [Streptomyces sp. 5-10]MBD3004644.1 hypothetical protein [Streptomyces sp. 5-10]